MTWPPGRSMTVLAATLALVVLGMAVAGTAAADQSAPDCDEVDYTETGDGTLEVETLNQLQCIEDEGLEENYVLVEDIDASDTQDWNDGDGFEPIGDGDINLGVEGDAFNGTFDGTDRTIADLTIDRGGDDFVGLFEVIGSEGTVSNLTLESATVTGDDRTGGLSGENYGTVSDVSMSIEVTGTLRAGGVIGSNYGGTITNATVEGAVFSEQDVGTSRVGGIVGDHERGASIDSSSFTNGTVDGDNEKIGGIAGRLSSLHGDSSSITNSSANGTIGNEDADSVGGLVGAGVGDLFDSYSTASVRGNDTVGGVIGYAGNSDIERTYAVGEVDGEEDDVGGLVGVGATGFNIENSYWDTETTGVSESFDSDEGGLTTDEMTGANAAANMDGFGFPDGDDRWHAVEDDYPVLSYEDTDPVYSVEITGTNSAIEEGETLEVDVTITNFGSDGNEQFIELRDFDGAEVDTDTVTLESGESTDLTLEWETEKVEDGLDDVTVASQNHTDTRTVSVGAGEVIAQCQPIDTDGAYELSDDIEASGDCIEIEADDVSLDGNDHTISGSGTGIVADEHSNVTITNVTLNGLDVGIEMTALENATVEHNTVEGGEEDGLAFENVQDTTVANNTVSESDGDGILFEDVQGSTIANNTVAAGATSGIYLADATGTAVENTTLRENDENGMYVVDSEELVVSGNEVVDNGEDDEDELSYYVEDAGIYLSGTSDSTLKANNLTANAQAALFLEESSEDNHILKININVSSIGDGKNWNGVRIDDSPGNTISDSVISPGEVASTSELAEYFIYVDTSETVVRDNEIDAWSEVGIDIGGGSNTVDNNSIAGTFHSASSGSGHVIRVDATGEDWSVTNNSLDGAEVWMPNRAGIATVGQEAVEIQNNTGTISGNDLEITHVEQSVENQQLTTPAGDTTVTFTGAKLLLDGMDEPPNIESPDGIESTGYYFMLDESGSQFGYIDLEFDYNETRLTSGDTIDPETLSLWRLGDEWEEIDDSDVDTDEQVVTGNVTEEGRIGIFGEEPALTDLDVDDVTIEQGEPLEVDLEDAEDSIGDPYDDESELVFEGDVFDEPVTKNVTFEDGEASGVELLDADETAALSAATTSIEVDIEGQDGADSFNLTVEAVLVAFDVADDVTIDQGEPLEIDIEDAEDKAGDDFDGTVDLVGDDIDGQEPSADDVEFDSGSASGVELLDAQATWGVSAGDYQNVTIDAVDTDVTAGFDVIIVEVFAGGDGSAEDPFVVENWDHLDTVRDYPDANVTMANDLDAETVGYGDVAAETANGGDGFEPISDFEGTFDGDNATIADLRINRSDESDVGLFGSTSDSTTIDDLRLENATVSGESNVGGLVGSLEGAVSSSSTNVTVTGEDGVGGLIGYNAGGDVTTSFSVGDVTGDDYVGGLAGFSANHADVSTSYATGTVTGDDYVGGLIGENYGDVSTSYATGDVDGEERVGGLVGLSGGVVDTSESYATGVVSGDSEVGGLVGSNSGDVSYSVATGEVDGGTSVGGLVGNGGEEDVSASYWDSNTTNQSESDGGQPLTTPEMTGLNATEHMGGFEFPDGDGTWHVTDDYPVLAWQATDPFYAVNLTDTTEPVEVTDPLEVSATITNWGADGEKTVELLDVDGTTVNSESVDVDSGESEDAVFTWQTDSGDAGDGDVTVDSGTDMDTASVTVQPQPSIPSSDPDIAVTGLELDETTIDTGADLIAIVTLTNTGDASGEYTFELTLDDEPVTTHRETVPDGETKTVTLTDSVSTPGSYTVAVGDQEAALEVVENETDADDDPLDHGDDAPDDDPADDPADDAEERGLVGPVIVGLVVVLAAGAGLVGLRSWRS